ncbi:hypothetical protein DTO032I3_1700 [Paecilomyces variotii]|nr:hypothetical protein DTO032I3_1700 [Paecilomyces variotii]KAJ9381603.1 hypothetical protein DTO032I4_6166 [Paecilomyces variotii]
MAVSISFSEKTSNAERPMAIVALVPLCDGLSSSRSGFSMTLRDHPERLVATSHDDVGREPSAPQTLSFLPITSQDQRTPSLQRTLAEDLPILVHYQLIPDEQRHNVI